MGNPSSISNSFELFRRLARRLGVPARDAEDVAQDALLRGLEAHQRIEPGGDPSPYSVTIALNQARNHVRNAHRRGEVLTLFDESEFRAESPNPEELLRGRQRHALTRRLIDRLDPKHRNLLLKHDLEEVPLVQIAAELGLKTEAVKKQHLRARDRLEAEKRRWTAEERARGRDGDACVPLAFGLHRRESWLATLRRLAIRILAQGAAVVLTGALASGASPGLESWLLPAAVRASGAAPTAEEVTAPARADGARSAVEIAAPAALEGAPPAQGGDAGALAAQRGDTGALATVDSRPAASAEPAPGSEMPVGAVRRNAASGSAVRNAVSKREWSLIRDARSALDAHNAVADLEARRLLEAHAREFPRGWLARERERLLRQIR
ncbi:RNA polymerase subunit sigma [Sorangium cellulosum]|uniref:RNA polymerase subunit sigma n=1 Tax=Sorangium cellulosum TaxID=56 RepID=A0A150R5A8_SORCE|nr:RNA polymerase subunit sigma [Sorangium cellulosum]